MNPKASRGNQWLVESRAGLVRYVAANLFSHGYRWYVTGYIPEHKDPHRVDEAILDKYNLRITKWERARRKRVGWASVRYLRTGRFFLLIATDGAHPFRTAETATIKDARRTPLVIDGYSMSIQKQIAGSGRGLWRPSIRIKRDTYLQLRAYFLELAVHRSEDRLRRELWNIPFEPYQPVVRQLHSLLRVVNKARKRARYSQIDYEVFRYRMKPIQVFATQDEEER